MITATLELREQEDEVRQEFRLEELPPPDNDGVKVQQCADPQNDMDRSCGIMYQRCGGGRRVIRKRI